MFKQKWLGIALLTVLSSSVLAATASTFVFDAQSVPDALRAVQFARNNQKALILQEEGKIDATTNDLGVVYLNLDKFNQMITLRLKEQSMIVQSGMTWNQVQQLIAPFGLTLKFIPAKANEPIFAAINHNQVGISPYQPWVANGIQSFRLLQADGSIVKVSRKDSPELWNAVFGGQGLFGVILDVKLRLVPNQNLIRHAKQINYEDYIPYLAEEVQDNPDIAASFARLDVAPGPNFLSDLYVVSYWIKDNNPAQASHLHPIRNNIVHSVVTWSEQGTWEKQLRWQIETSLLGNQWMHPELTQSDLLMRQARLDDNPNQQIYYIPADQFVSFVDDLRALSFENQWTFNQVSVRYAAKASRALLSPNAENMLAITISFDKSVNGGAQAAATQLMNLALDHEGSFALNQVATMNVETAKIAYPQFAEFQQLKAQYDVNNLFVSTFYPG